MNFVTLLLTKYYSGDQIKNNVMGGVCRMYGERRHAYSFLVAKPEVTRSRRRNKVRGEDNMKVKL
jgi:hypothetical protein